MKDQGKGVVDGGPIVIQNAFGKSTERLDRDGDSQTIQEGTPGHPPIGTPVLCCIESLLHRRFDSSSHPSNVIVRNVANYDDTSEDVVNAIALDK